MGIGTQAAGSIGRGKSAGPIGTKREMHGSALTLDQNKTKVGYPTTSTTLVVTTTTATPTTTT